jgi:hypothetical protein
MSINPRHRFAALLRFGMKMKLTVGQFAARVSVRPLGNTTRCRV